MFLNYGAPIFWCILSHVCVKQSCKWFFEVQSDSKNHVYFNLQLSRVLSARYLSLKCCPLVDRWNLYLSDVCPSIPFLIFKDSSIMFVETARIWTFHLRFSSTKNSLIIFCTLLTVSTCAPVQLYFVERAVNFASNHWQTFCELR